ncbi:hypothetical protein ACJX0J_031092, partial [Zea mays]
DLVPVGVKLADNAQFLRCDEVQLLQSFDWIPSLINLNFWFELISVSTLT